MPSLRFLKFYFWHIKRKLLNPYQKSDEINSIYLRIWKTLKTKTRSNPEIFAPRPFLTEPRLRLKLGDVPRPPVIFGDFALNSSQMLEWISWIVWICSCKLVSLYVLLKLVESIRNIEVFFHSDMSVILPSCTASKVSQTTTGTRHSPAIVYFFVRDVHQTRIAHQIEKYSLIIITFLLDLRKYDNRYYLLRYHDNNTHGSGARALSVSARGSPGFMTVDSDWSLLSCHPWLDYFFHRRFSSYIYSFSSSCDLGMDGDSNSFSLQKAISPSLTKKNQIVIHTFF